MATEARDIVPFEPQRHNIIVMPLVDPAQAKDAMERYEALKSAIVQDSDYHTIGNGPNARKFLKKAFWRRVGTFFGLSLKLVSEEVIFDERTPQVYGYSVIYSATAPNGAYMEGDGMCMSNERAGMRRHDVRATAHTRAKNRAISDLVGGGEVSADEMPDYVDATPPQPTRSAPTRPMPAAPSERPAADDPHKLVTPQIKQNPSALKARAARLGITGEAWGDLWREYGGIINGISDYLDAKEASMRPATVDENTQIEYALEGLPVSGMH